MFGVDIPEPERVEEEPSYNHKRFANGVNNLPNPHNAYRYSAKELRREPIVDCDCGVAGCTGKKLAKPPPPPPYRVPL